MDGGSSALRLAIDGLHRDVVNVLLDAGLDVNGTEEEVRRDGRERGERGICAVPSDVMGLVTLM